MNIDDLLIDSIGRATAYDGPRRTPAVGIIGGGMSGVCMAVMLRRSGIRDITVFEKASELGGTWRDNVYPGLYCDVPARFYQYSFAPNPHWTRVFASGTDIHAYLRRIADRFDVRQHFRFNTEVTEARFVDNRWQVHTADGAVATFDFLIAATGVLRVPRYPDIPGLGDFHGPVMHSARWDRAAEVVGKRVAVIGTGSTGVQIATALAETTARLDLFQRSANWVVTLPNPRYSALTRAAHRRWPMLDRLGYDGYERFFEFFSRAVIRSGWRRTLLSTICRANLHTVDDSDVRRMLTPDYKPMCRRLIVSGGFLRAVRRGTVHVVDTGIDHIAERGVVTTDGVLHECDAIVLATGFDAHAYLRPMRLYGRDGIGLDDAWRDGPQAHLTVAVPGFPNFFMLLGPHSPIGNYSLTAIAEMQARHIAA